MPLRQLSNGSFNPTGAPFAVTAFSCSVGKFPSGVRRKPGRAADAAHSGPANREPCQSGGELGPAGAATRRSRSGILAADHPLTVFSDRDPSELVVHSTAPRPVAQFPVESICCDSQHGGGIEHEDFGEHWMVR
jgi:hypothetical protein